MNDKELIGKTIVYAEVGGYGLRLKFNDGSILNYISSSDGESYWEIIDAAEQSKRCTMRLIDANKLKAKQQADADLFIGDDTLSGKLRRDEALNAVANIVNAPTVDPVKHGQWIDKYGDGDWHCSCCGAIVENHEQDYRNWYFCYHCGARMNGDENG